MSVNDTKMIKQLLEAGVHFGHQTNRWNPKMKQYIFGAKSGIYIIDLEKTSELLEKACKFIRDVARAGSYVLFVGTKKQAQSIVKEQAERSGMFYVNQRWLGGTLTNFSTIRKSIDKLDKLEAGRTDGTYDAISKKERAARDKTISKLLKNLAGIRGMDRLPGAVIVIDSKAEEIAVKEARKLKIPVLALIDTNSNPDLIDYVIPGNDDALKSISLITYALTESIIDGRNQFLVGSGKKNAESADQSKKENKKNDKKEDAKETAKAKTGTKNVEEKEAEESEVKESAEAKAE